MIHRESFKGMKVLIVDDDPPGLEIMALLLQHFGAITHKATNGREGIEQAQLLHPDFIISDLSMPVMDGWEMIAWLKHERTTASIPIIALTAHAMIGDRERAIAAGCHNYLTKPINPPTFIHDLYMLLVEIPELAEQLSQERAS